MSRPVVLLPVSALSAGDLLGRDVTDGEGALVAPAGHVIDQRLLDRFRSMGLSQVAVASAYRRREAEINDQDVRESLDHLFRHWRLSPCMRQLRKLLTEYRTGVDR